MLEHSTTEGGVNHGEEIADLRDRQTRLESSLQAVTNTVQQVAEIQQTQQATLTTLTGDVQSILSAVKNREGRVNIATVVSVLTPLAALVGVLAALYIAPLRQQITNVEEEAALRLSDLASNFYRHRDEDGHVVTQLKLTALQERDAALIQRFERIEAAYFDRLHEEAELGRKSLYRQDP